MRSQIVIYLRTGRPGEEAQKEAWPVDVAVGGALAFALDAEVACW